MTLRPHSVWDVAFLNRSRIPTYSGERENVVGFLYVKDLAFVDPDDKTPVESVVKYYDHQVEWVYDTTPLDKMLEIFKASRTHIVLVMTIDGSGDTDPVRKVVGIATLEDVIEDIIQQEIIDETDTVCESLPGPCLASAVLGCTIHFGSIARGRSLHSSACFFPAVDNITKSKIEKSHGHFMHPFDFGTMQPALTDVPLSDQVGPPPLGLENGQPQPAWN